MAHLSGWLSSHIAGDVAMIQPSNLPDVIDEFISLLELNADQVFLLEQNDPGEYSICVLTCRFSQPIKRKMLELWAVLLVVRIDI